MYAKKLFPLFLVFLSACGGRNVVMTSYRHLPDYPSASGIAFVNHHLYVIGDDAQSVLILDSNLNPLDSIILTNFPGKKIPKNIKPDIESVAVIRENGSQKLLMLGSGSLSPYRDRGWVIDPVSREIDSIQLDVFYGRLKTGGLPFLNIEGSCNIPGAVILSNRGNKGFPNNHLIITSPKWWQNQAHAPFKLVRMGTNTDTSTFSGISGLTYAPKSDRLLLTVSTEDTRSAYEDGAIGKSYLWIVTNISSKKNWQAINPERIIDLEEVDPAFKGQKIESVAVVKETRKFLHLVLAADNDNGSSSLFTLLVEKGN